MPESELQTYFTGCVCWGGGKLYLHTSNLHKVKPNLVILFQCSANLQVTFSLFCCKCTVYIRENKRYTKVPKTLRIYKYSVYCC